MMLTRLFKKIAAVERCNNDLSDYQMQVNSSSYINNDLLRNCSSQSPNTADSSLPIPTILLISSIAFIVIVILALLALVYAIAKKPIPESIPNQDEENPSNLSKAEIIQAVNKLLNEIELEINKIPTWKQSEITYCSINRTTLNLHAQAFEGKDRKCFVSLATSRYAHHHQHLVAKGVLLPFNQSVEQGSTSNPTSHSTTEENDSIHLDSTQTSSKLTR